jgi:hypothetical protein
MARTAEQLLLSHSPCSVQATEALAGLVDEVPQYKAYINFLDTDVPALAPSWQQAYYGDAYHTLQCINDKWVGVGRVGGRVHTPRGGRS